MPKPLKNVIKVLLPNSISGLITILLSVQYSSSLILVEAPLVKNGKGSFSKSFLVIVLSFKYLNVSFAAKQSCKSINLKLSKLFGILYGILVKITSISPILAFLRSKSVLSVNILILTLGYFL